MSSLLSVREIAPDTLTCDAHGQFLDILIGDWSKVDGVNEETARSMMETHRTLGDIETLRKVIGETSTRLCFIDHGENNAVAAAMVGERKYGDDQYYMNRGLVLPIIYQAMRLQYKARRKLTGQPPRSSEASIFAWGAQEGFETPALAAVLPWIEQQYPYTRSVVVDVNTGDHRLAGSIEEITGARLDPVAPKGVITFGEEDIPQTFQRITIPYPRKL
jgi:hypothetical protein